MDLVPKMSSADAEAKAPDKDLWNHFARKIVHHPGVKKYLWMHQSGKCARCRQSMNGSFSIHHVDYDHWCGFAATKIVRTPTPKRPTREREIPDCKRCHQEARGLFDQCMIRLRAVHKGCNALLHQDMLRRLE